MAELILHHYAVSPFSEKIRKLLAWKKLAWRGAEQPIVAPKPKLTPLTGGYRKIPVLQIGADVYCDTVSIIRVLESRHPEPSSFGGQAGAVEMVSQWADHRLFLAAVPPAIVDLLPVLPANFIADRAAMSPGFSLEAFKAAVPHARSQLLVAYAWLEEQLASRPFVLGDTFTAADAACFHSLWFLRNSGEANFAPIAARPGLARWFARVDAMGQGEMTPIDPDEALDIARSSRPETQPLDDGSDPAGIRIGDSVSVVPDDYGVERVTGRAVVVTAHGIALARRDDRVGEVVVHFPRSGFRVTKE